MVFRRRWLLRRIGGQSTSRRWPVAAVVSGDVPPQTLLGGDTTSGAGSPRRVPSPSGGWPRTHSRPPLRQRRAVGEHVPNLPGGAGDTPHTVRNSYWAATPGIY